MRRLLFNPLAQQPYASGELNMETKQFLLDKKIEYGHLYYARIICTSYEYQTCCLIDACDYKNTIFTTPIAFIGSNDDFAVANARVDEGVLSIDEGSVTISTTNSYIVYIYKLMQYVAPTPPTTTTIVRWLFCCF